MELGQLEDILKRVKQIVDDRSLSKKKIFDMLYKDERPTLINCSDFSKGDLVAALLFKDITGKTWDDDFMLRIKYRPWSKEDF